MPETLAPGVRVEETSLRSTSIIGVATSTTAFVGPTRRSPIGGMPELLTSLVDFERLCGKLEEGDTLVVTKINRIGRDSIDVQQTVQMFAERKVRLVVLQLGNLDLTSTAGALIVKVLAAMGDFERSLIVERTKAGQARARAEGKHMGRPSKTNDEQKLTIRLALADNTVSQVARNFKISRASVIAIRETA